MSWNWEKRNWLERAQNSRVEMRVGRKGMRAVWKEAKTELTQDIY